MTNKCRVFHSLMILIVTPLAAEAAAAVCQVPRELGVSSSHAIVARYLEMVARNRLGANGPTLPLINFGPGPLEQHSPVIPTSLIKAIAWNESLSGAAGARGGWKQFDDTHLTLMSANGDCGYGIMQVTMSDKNPAPSWIQAVRVAASEQYNIGVGARILIEKWNGVSSIGSDDPSIYEHWYYAVWAYNGVAGGQKNHPNNPKFDKYRPFLTATKDQMPYQEWIWHLLREPEKDTYGDLWNPVPVFFTLYNQLPYDSTLDKTPAFPVLPWTGPTHVDDDLSPKISVTSQPALSPKPYSNASASSYSVGETVNVTFTIRNVGTVPSELREIVFGGRLKARDCAATGNPCPDFRDPKSINVTVAPGDVHVFTGSYTFDEAGQYTYMVYYKTLDDKWHWGSEVVGNSEIIVTVDPFCRAPTTARVALSASRYSAAASSCPLPPSMTVAETFQNQNAWTYSVAAGSPTSKFALGDWRITSPNSANPGSSAMVLSKFLLAGNSDVTFDLQHAGFGATTVGLMQGGTFKGHLTLDTDDTKYVFYCPDTAALACDGYLQYPSAPYMNQKIAVRIKTSASRVQFFINGTLMQTYPYMPPAGPYQLAFSASSISWKSGANISDLYSITATADTVSGTLPTTTQIAPSLSSVDVSQMVGGQLTPVFAVGAGFDSGVSLQFSDSGACANYACTIPNGDVLSRSATNISARSSLAAGQYSARAKNATGAISNSLTVTVRTATASAGTITIATTNSVSVGCVLNGTQIVAPTSAPGKTPGTYQLSCVAPSGYTLSSIAPSATQILVADGTSTWTVNLILKVPQLTGYCTANGSTSPQTSQVGNQVTWNVITNGGTGPNDFAWTGVSAGNTQSVVLIPNSAATYATSVVVADSGNPKQQISLSCPQVTVSTPPPISAYCSVSPNPLSLGATATLTAGAVGGFQPYTFLFPGTGIYSSSSTMAVSPSAPGSVSYQVTAKDSRGQTNSTQCSLSVALGDPFFTKAQATPSPVRRTAVVTVQLWGGNFASGQTQVAFVGPGCSLGACTSNALTFVAVPVAAYMEARAVLNTAGSYSVSVRNGSGIWMIVPGMTISVTN